MSVTLSAEGAVRQYVEAVRRDIEPDPLFRRRLRGTVLNTFVANREGADVATRLARRNRMGALGRACLYASLATALSVGGVMAASESAIPGDLLYPLKRSIEEMRVKVAPAHLQDELATYALAERIDELGRLVEAGDLARATDLALDIGNSYDELASSSGATFDDGRLAANLARLEAVLDSVPAPARQAIERVMSFAPGLLPGDEPQGRPDTAGTSSSGPDATGEGGADGQDGGAGTGGSQAERTPRPEPTPEPVATPRPERTEQPEPSPKPEPSAKPNKSPQASVDAP